MLTAHFDESGLCRILEASGAERIAFETVYEAAFNSQYPPPLSLDGQVLYVGNWERGVYCYCVADGKLLWRQGPGKAQHIFPVDDSVVVEMADRGLYCRDQRTGRIRHIRQMSGITVAERLSEDRVFAGPYRRRYQVLQIPTLKPLAFVRESLLNPDACLSFVIREAREIENDIEVAGFEQYPGGQYSESDPRDFRRRVPVEAA